MDRFDLEQQILESWNVVRDIQLLAKQEAPTESFSALATVYEHRFQELWDTFEGVVLPQTDATKVSFAPSTTVTGQGITSTTFFVGDTELRVSYGWYDGERILGIDAPLETVSVAMEDLAPLIDVLNKLNQTINHHTN